MSTHSSKIAFTVMVALTIASAAGVLAHPVSYKGTVMSVEPKALQVKVMDDMSKRASTLTFDVTAETKVFRGDKPVRYADAGIQKGERVAVTIDHDEPGEQAAEIRLAAAR